MSEISPVSPEPEDQPDPELFVNDVLKMHPQVTLEHLKARLMQIADESQNFLEQSKERADEVRELQSLNERLQSLSANTEFLNIQQEQILDLTQQVGEVYEELTAVRQALESKRWITRSSLRKLMVVNVLSMSLLTSSLVVAGGHIFVTRPLLQKLEVLRQENAALLRHVQRLQKAPSSPTR